MSKHKNSNYNIGITKKIELHASKTRIIGWFLCGQFKPVTHDATIWIKTLGCGKLVEKSYRVSYLTILSYLVGRGWQKSDSVLSVSFSHTDLLFFSSNLCSHNKSSLTCRLSTTRRYMLMHFPEQMSQYYYGSALLVSTCSDWYD